MQVSPQPLVDVSEGSTHVCKPLYDAYEQAAQNYYIKYGEMSKFYSRAEDEAEAQDDVGEETRTSGHRHEDTSCCRG